MIHEANDAKLKPLHRTSMACPSSRSKVTTHTHSSQEEKRAQGQRLCTPSASSWRGEVEPSNGFITTGSKLGVLHRSSSRPPSLITGPTGTSVPWQRGLWSPLLEARATAVRNGACSLFIHMVKIPKCMINYTGRHKLRVHEYFGLRNIYFSGSV